MAFRASVLFCVCNLFAAAGNATLWQASGSGFVSDDSQVGVPGEAVRFSFEYDDRWFPASEPLYDPYNVMPAISIFYFFRSTNAIPVQVYGDISGQLPANSINSATAYNSGRGDSFNFLSDAALVSSQDPNVPPGYPDLIPTSTGILRAYTGPWGFDFCDARGCQEGAFDPVGTANDFRTVNRWFSAAINGDVVTEGPWTNLDGVFRGGEGAVSFRVDGWTVTSVPEPGPLSAMLLGFVALVARRYFTASSVESR